MTPKGSRASLWPPTGTLTSKNKKGGEKTFRASQRLLQRWSPWQEEVIAVWGRGSHRYGVLNSRDIALCPIETSETPMYLETSLAEDTITPIAF